MSTSRLTAYVFMLAGISATVQAAPMPPPANGEAQLRAINQRLLGGDSSAGAGLPDADSLIGRDFLFIDHDGSWVGREDFLRRVRQMRPAGSASIEDVSVRMFGQVAVLHGLIEGSPTDKAISRIRFTSVYVWNEKIWQLVGGQITSLKSDVSVRQYTGTAPLHLRWQGQDPVGDDLAVLELLNEQYVNAFREADVAWYDAHLAPDYVVVSGDGSFDDRATALTDFAQPYFADHINSFPVAKVRIRRFGDIALIHAENAYVLKDRREGVNRYTDIWRKQDGMWRCIAAHITVHKAPSH